MACGKGGGDLYHEGDIPFEGFGGREPKNEWGRGIHPKNRNIERTGSISVGGVKWPAEGMEVTSAVRGISSLRGLVIGNPKTSGAGGFTPKTGISSAPARHRWGV
jgi:hypothetical protein